MADTPLVLNGRNVPTALLRNGARILGAESIALRWDFEEKVTEFDDQYLGNPRTRPDKIVDGYMVNVEYHVANLTIINALKEIDNANDRNTPLGDLSFAITFGLRVGGAEGMICRGCVHKVMLNSPGREQRLVNKVTLRFPEWEYTSL